MSYIEKLNRFAANPVSMNMKRTKFNRDHTNTITFNSGFLVPILFDEILPDDTVSLDIASVVRSITPAVPVMDNSFIDLYAFWVPNRLATVHDKDWQKICGENVNGFWAPTTEATLENTGNTVDFSGAGSLDAQSLADYLGLLPVGFSGGSNLPPMSRLPLNAYTLIWNEFFRDENLQAEVAWKTFNDYDCYLHYFSNSYILPVGKVHDYFTSALPGLQKGASVLLPMAGSAPVVTSSTEHTTGNAYPLKLRESTAGAIADSNRLLGTGTTGALYDTNSTYSGAQDTMYPSNLYADLTAATAVSVNEMRQAFALQKLLEKDARGGWACA